MNKFRWVLYTILVFNLFSCRLEPELEARYRIPLTIFPQSAQLKIGDTLWLSYSSQDSFLINLLNQEKVSLKGKSFSFRLNGYYIDLHEYSNPKFDFVEDGIFNTSFSGKNFYISSIGCNSDFPFIKLAIIPREKGTFILRPSIDNVKGLHNKLDICGANSSFIQDNLTELFYYFTNADLHDSFISESIVSAEDKAELKRLSDNKYLYFFKVID
ncbi:MAG: hypothetical protein IPH96_12790 [Saprospiraceae bacterium]|nr:hypothetical protein [Saprospiraceae bacterium]